MLRSWHKSTGGSPGLERKRCIRVADLNNEMQLDSYYYLSTEGGTLGDPSKPLVLLNRSQWMTNSNADQALFLCLAVK
jgi:hypothetical protein